MGRYIARRLIQMVPLVLGITLITFALANLVPGSPVPQLEQQLRTTGRVSHEDIERIKEDLGLDQPVYIRYVAWLGNVVQGDLGISIQNYTPVMNLIIQKLPNTLILTTSAFVLSLLMAVPIGVYSAVKHNSRFDNATTATTVAFYSIPTFWFALLLIMLLAVKFKEWGLPSFPSGGAYDLRDGGGLIDRVEHLILPVFTLAIVQTAVWVRYIRSQMLEVLNQDYVRTARAKGLKERLVIFRHGLRNALLPLVTLFGMAVPDLFGGALIIEQIFTYPGMGHLAFHAAINKDYPLIMGTVLFATFLVLLGNLIADIAYSVVDPRVRLS